MFVFYAINVSMSNIQLIFTKSDSKSDYVKRNKLVCFWQQLFKLFNINQVWIFKIKQSWTRNRKWCTIVFTILSSIIKIILMTINFVINLSPMKVRQCITQCQKSFFVISTFANRWYNFRVLDSNESCFHVWVALR